MHQYIFYIEAKIDTRVGYVGRNVKVSIKEMGYFRSVCVKQEEMRVRKEWMPNGCVLNIKPNNKGGGSLLRRFSHTERLNENQIIQQIHEERVNKKR